MQASMAVELRPLGPARCMVAALDAVFRPPRFCGRTPHGDHDGNLERPRRWGVAAGGGLARAPERADHPDQCRPGRDSDHRRGDDRLARARGACGERARHQRHVRAAAVRHRRGRRDHADDRAGSWPPPLRGARAAAHRPPGPMGGAGARPARVRAAVAHRAAAAPVAPGPGAHRGSRAVRARGDVGVRAGAVVRRAAQLHRVAGAAARRHGDHADRRLVQRDRRLRPDLRQAGHAGARADRRRDRSRADQLVRVCRFARLRADRSAVPALSYPRTIVAAGLDTPRASCSASGCRSA